MYTSKEIYRFYKRKGFSNTLYRAIDEIYTLLLSLLYFFIDKLIANEDDYVCIVPRSNKLDQDTISLITQNSIQQDQFKIVVAVSSIDDLIVENEKSFKSLKDFNFKIVQINSMEFISWLAKCNTVLLKNQSSIWQYRLFSDKSKKFIRLLHGVSAKGYRKNQKNECSFRTIIGNWMNIANKPVISVGSDIVLHRKSAHEQINVDGFEKYGQPRFDRLRFLKKNPDKSLLSERTKHSLQSSEYNILYAPTHKDGVYKTELFPFPDSNMRKLESYLMKNGIHIYIRLHIHEENSGLIDEYTNYENIHYAGHEFSFSAVELMPYFDALVTDFSSIYLDYVLLDRPMLFVKDKFDKYKELRGLAFNYDQYWPGPKIDTQEEFINEIEKLIITDNDPYAYERKFVRDTFHPPTRKSFLENIK